MTTSTIDNSQRTAARVAALAYLIPVALIVYANFGLRGPLFVSGDMAETVRRIAANEGLFRLSVTLDVAYCAGAVVLLTALYVVLSPVSRHAALLATILKLLYAGTAVLMALSFADVVRLVTNPAFAALPAEQLHALVKLNSSATFDEYYVGLAFWSLSATLIGWLWLRSGYIPRALAGFGLASAAWCAFCTFAFLIEPGFARVVNLWFFDTPLALFDIALSVWLLAKGLPHPALA